MTECKRQQKPSTFAQEHEKIPDTIFQSSNSESASNPSLEDCVPTERRKTTENIQNRATLKELAIISERYGLSDRAAAALTTAPWKDFAIISYDDTSLVIDRSKLRRERQKHCLAIPEEKRV